MILLIYYAFWKNEKKNEPFVYFSANTVMQFIMHLLVFCFVIYCVTLLLSLATLTKLKGFHCRNLFARLS